MCSNESLVNHASYVGGRNYCESSVATIIVAFLYEKNVRDGGPQANEKSRTENKTKTLTNTDFKQSFGTIIEIKKKNFF